MAKQAQEAADGKLSIGQALTTSLRELDELKEQLQTERANARVANEELQKARNQRASRLLVITIQLAGRFGDQFYSI